MSAWRWLRRWWFYVVLTPVFTANASMAVYDFVSGASPIQAATRLILAATVVLCMVALWFSERTSAMTRALRLEVEADLALITAARRPVVMPEFDVDLDGRIRRISFPPVTIPSGESASWAVPRIRGWPPMDLIVRRAGENEGARVRVNWEEGTVDIFDAGGLRDFKIDVSREKP